MGINITSAVIDVEESTMSGGCSGKDFQWTARMLRMSRDNIAPLVWNSYLKLLDVISSKFRWLYTNAAFPVVGAILAYEGGYAST